jgi:hypothetical protein
MLVDCILDPANYLEIAAESTAEVHESRRRPAGANMPTVTDMSAVLAT